MKNVFQPGKPIKYPSSRTRIRTLDQFLGGAEINATYGPIDLTGCDHSDLKAKFKSNNLKAADLPSTVNSIPFVYD